MIVFDLACPAGHVFEAWFGSTADYDGQRARGLVSCPLCGSAAVDKAVMAPRVASKANRRSLPVKVAPAATLPTSPSAPAAQETPPGPEAVKGMLRALAEAQARALERSDYVGPRFAEEARAIHDGETERRPIHGQASVAEAKALIEDGIEVAPLPFPVRPPGADH